MNPCRLTCSSGIGQWNGHTTGVKSIMPVNHDAEDHNAE